MDSPLAHRQKKHERTSPWNNVVVEIVIQDNLPWRYLKCLNEHISVIVGRAAQNSKRSPPLLLASSSAMVPDPSGTAYSPLTLPPSSHSAQMADMAGG